MTRRYLAIIMVISLIGMCSPALAGDLVSPKLLGSLSERPYLRGSIAAFSLPQAGQAPAKSQPQSKEWTKPGKIMTIAGLGVVGAGAVMMTRSNSTVYSSGNQSLQINWKATGGITMGGGAVLALIGLTRRH